MPVAYFLNLCLSNKSSGHQRKRFTAIINIISNFLSLSSIFPSLTITAFLTLSILRHYPISQLFCLSQALADIHTHRHTFTDTFMLTHTHRHTFTDTFMLTHTHTHTHTDLLIHPCEHTHPCLYTQACTQTHMPMLACTLAHTQTIYFWLLENGIGFFSLIAPIIVFPLGPFCLLGIMSQLFLGILQHPVDK